MLLVTLQVQSTTVSAGLSDGVYLISQKPIVQLGSTTYYLSLSGVSEKAQLQILKEESPGNKTQMWEIKNVQGGVTLKNVAFGCYGYVGSLWDVLPIGAPLLCSPDGTSVPQVFQPEQNEDGTYRIKHFNWSDPSLFFLMHTVPLDPSLGAQKTYGNISFVPLATNFATYFWFKWIGNLTE
ncbi:hypothetical protein OPQ81_008413 [Rhizoctonia solani]|nr:hypothetical protein OPQ81_008413 [Rhizoctonia solani]